MAAPKQANWSTENPLQWSGQPINAPPPQPQTPTPRFASNKYSVPQGEISTGMGMGGDAGWVSLSLRT